VTATRATGELIQQVSIAFRPIFCRFKSNKLLVRRSFESSDPLEFVQPSSSSRLFDFETKEKANQSAKKPVETQSNDEKKAKQKVSRWER
jgi:hypothetical protein